MELTVNDFFCGAGGVGLGFQQAGFKIIWACDFDKYAVQTYRHNVGNYVIQADIKKLSRADIPTADVWAFGFPCQDLSIAGKQKGFRFISAKNVLPSGVTEIPTIHNVLYAKAQSIKQLHEAECSLR